MVRLGAMHGYTHGQTRFTNPIGPHPIVPPVSKKLLAVGPPVSKELVTGGPPVSNFILNLIVLEHVAGERVVRSKLVIKDQDFKI